MKLRQNHFCWVLAMAVALVMTTMTACSSENDLVETPNVEQPTQPTQSKKVHVMVGAGIADDATTRSEVVTEDGKKILKFTAGDKLYVFAPVSKNSTNDGYIIMAGTLDIDPASIVGGTSASFTGDLDLYEWDSSQSKYVPNSTYTFSTSNPLKECDEFCQIDNVYPYDVKAQLIHSGSEGAFHVEDNPGNIYEYLSNFYYYYVLLPTDANDLMKSCLNVKADTYDRINERFNLASENHSAIFSCAISGLKVLAEYRVSVNNNYQGNMQTNNEGHASFAIDYKENSWGNEKSYSIVLTNTADNTDTYTIDLGTRTLQKKIYNVTRYWNGTAFGRPMATAKSEDVGKVIGADGCIYSDATAAVAAGTTAQAVISYVGAQAGVCTHGLAIALADEYDYNTVFSGAQTGISQITYDHPISGATWRLPTVADWQYMITGSTSATYFSDISTFQTILGSAALTSGYYWTGTEDGDDAYAFYYSGTDASVNSKVSKTEFYARVRACLTF